MGGPLRVGRLRHWWAAACVAVVVALPLRGLYRTPGSTMEEGFMLTFPERVLKGAVPNVDFLHLYGPTSLDVLAVGYEVFGARLHTERTFGLLQHIALIAAIFVLARAWGRSPPPAAPSSARSWCSRRSGCRRWPGPAAWRSACGR